MDATDLMHPNGLHPDQHHLVTSPDDPFQFFESNDGGVMRSDGTFADASAFCAPRGLTGVTLARCQQLLSRVPKRLEGINDGMPTLQFMSLSVSPFNSKIVQGGTQDNGTWETQGNTNRWLNTMIGDGGQSGFDAAMPDFRFHTFFDTSPEVNFSAGETADWIWIADPLYAFANNPFYSAVITDPVVSKTMFAGNGPGAWRTKTHGLGDMTLEEANEICNTWTGTFSATCGDWVRIDAVPLNSPTRGDRVGVGAPSAVVAIERTAADSSTAWAATGAGRVLVSKNVDAEPASAVTWTRIDLPTTPGRFSSSIYVDPKNGNRAWVSYSGYDATTPTTPGHVFEVVFNPAAGTAAWTNKSHDLGDLPITDVVFDGASGDIYVSNDFGVLRLAQGTSTWTAAAPGMPNVEVAGLTYVAEDRILYAATHGLGAWRLNLESSHDPYDDGGPLRAAPGELVQLDGGRTSDRDRRRRKPVTVGRRINARRRRRDPSGRSSRSSANICGSGCVAGVVPVPCCRRGVLALAFALPLVSRCRGRYARATAPGSPTRATASTHRAPVRTSSASTTTPEPGRRRGPTSRTTSATCRSTISSGTT